MAYHKQLEQLTIDFARDIEIARNVKSSNPEDDLAIRAAIVGFSYHCETSSWAKGHFEFVNQRLVANYSSEQLDEYGENGENVRLFFALAIGFLLGLYQQKEITDDQFEEGEQQIPGIIMLYLPRLTGKSV